MRFLRTTGLGMALALILAGTAAGLRRFLWTAAGKTTKSNSVVSWPKYLFASRTHDIWQSAGAWVRLIISRCFVAGPSAVARLVVSIVVDAVQNIAMWFFPHVREEVLEAVEPPFANRNSSSSIAMVIRSLWIKAALLHVEPCEVFRRLLLSFPGNPRLPKRLTMLYPTIVMSMEKQKRLALNPPTRSMFPLCYSSFPSTAAMTKTSLYVHALTVSCALFICLAFCPSAYPQGTQFSNDVLRNTAIIAGASVRVCVKTATGTPCTPLATIYSDEAMTSVDADSIVTADSAGRFTFYAPAGCYKLQISAAGFSTSTITECKVGGSKFANTTAGIIAAIADLPSTGGTVDARSIEGPITISSDIFSGVTKPGVLLLGNATFTFTVAQNIPENWTIRGNGPRNTILKAGANIWVLQSLHDAPGIQQLMVSNLTIDGNKANFAASGGIYLKRVFQLSLLENLFIQDFGSLGGIKWENYDVNGGMMSNIELLGDISGTIGGAGAGDCLTLDATNNMLLNSITCEYVPNGIVVKAQSVPSLVSVFLNKYHSEGVSGSSIDLQANVALFHAKGVFMIGGGGSNIGVKIASSATYYDFENIEFAGNWGNNIQIAGNNFNPTEKFAYRFNSTTLAQGQGTLTWLGSTTPSDPGAAIEVRSNATNLLRLASDANVEALKTTATTTTLSRTSGGGVFELKNLDVAGSTYAFQVDVNNTLILGESGVANRIWLAKTTGYVGIGAQGGVPLDVVGKVRTTTQFESTQATGTAPLVVASTTQVANLNASLLGGKTFADPGAIGTTPSTVGATTLTAAKYATATNCASAAGTCGSAAAGAVTIAAAASTVTVSTTAVNAASRIFIFENSTLGTELSVTCNTTIARTYAVTTVTPATSFIITASAVPITNPACLTYVIVN